MAQPYSDNFSLLHNKPFQEYERKNVDGVYVDWDSSTELFDTLNDLEYTSAFTANKYFWVAGTYFQCDSDGVTLRTVSTSGATTKYLTATAGAVSTFPSMVGQIITGPILRGGIGSGEVITEGTPTGDQIKFDSATGSFQVDDSEVGAPFLEGEVLTVTSGTIGLSPAPPTNTPQVLAPGTTVNFDYLLGKQGSLDINSNVTINPYNDTIGDVLTITIPPKGSVYTFTVPTGDKINTSVPGRSGYTITLPTGADITLTALNKGSYRVWNISFAN